MDTYTSQYGNTPVGNQTQSMSDTIASITGSPAAGALAQASATGPNYGATPMPQLANSEDALRTMFANDQVLAQKYMAGGGGSGPNVAGAFASPLQATPNSVASPTISTPAGITGVMGQTVGGQQDVLSSIMDAMDFNQTRTADTYKNMLSALQFLAGKEYDKQLKEEELAAQYGTGSPEDDLADSYVEQIKGGLKLTSVPANVRNRVVKKLSEQGLTIDKVNKMIEGKPIIQNLSDLKDLWDKIPPVQHQRGPLAIASGIGKELLSKIGYETELKAYEKKRDVMISSLRQLVKQGGNMSNRDMLRIENGLAKITDTPETSNITWNEIMNTVKNTYGDDVVAENWTSGMPDSTGNTPNIPSTNDPLGIR